MILSLVTSQFLTYFRFFLIIVTGISLSGGMGSVVGLGLALTFPHPTPKTPLFWRTEMLKTSPVSLQALSQLTPQERQQFLIELQGLQKQYQSIDSRLTQLESQFTLNPHSSPLDSRLKFLEKALENPQSLVKTISYPSQTKITLPLPLLFNTNSIALKSSATLILDNLIADFQSQKITKILIKVDIPSHSHHLSREILEFQQAKVIEQYCLAKLGKIDSLITVIDQDIQSSPENPLTQTEPNLEIIFN